MNFINLSQIHFQPEHIEISQPEWLWLIPVFIFLKLIIHFEINRISWLEKSPPASIDNINEISKNKYYHPLIKLFSDKNIKIGIKSRRSFFYSLLFILLILALSQPVYIGEKLPDPPQKRDIIFIVDTSVSMILRDYELNGQRIDRMNLLKSVLDNFIQKLKGERISIIVFGDQPYTLVPLTTDQMLLRNMLYRVQATMAGRFNAMGDAIALAVKLAGQNLNGASIDDKRKRVLVLMTDSDQPTGKIDPEAAALLAQKESLPLYTIAIGSTNLSAGEDSKSGLLYSPVDLVLLEKLSRITGAKSYHAKNPSTLTEAIDSIKTHETNKDIVEPVYIREDYYHWILLLVLFLFIPGQLSDFIKFYQGKNSLS